MKERMTVTKALNELKLLNARIEKETGNTLFVTTAKKALPDVNPYLSKKKFQDNAKAAYDSIEALIHRRAAIKSAIMVSNALTKVVIAGKEYTVAEAIDMKEVSKLRKDLASIMTKQLEFATKSMDKANVIVETKCDDAFQTYLSSLGAGKNTIDRNSDIYTIVTAPYRTNAEVELVQGFDVAEKIKWIDDEINAFLSEVDAELQRINCVTYIEFE